MSDCGGYGDGAAAVAAVNELRDVLRPSSLEFGGIVKLGERTLRATRLFLAGVFGLGEYAGPRWRAHARGARWALRLAIGGTAVGQG